VNKESQNKPKITSAVRTRAKRSSCVAFDFDKATKRGKGTAATIEDSNANKNLGCFIVVWI
jgi:hypothetical protein